MRKSVELVKEFTYTINGLNEGLIYDQFGFFDTNIPTHFKVKRVPRSDNTSLIDACKERAEELGTVNLAWSGGIDSTFLLAIFRSIGVDVVPIYFTDIGSITNNELLNFVRENFNLVETTLDEWVTTGKKVYTGCGADDLFNCTQRPPKSKIVFSYANGNTETVYKPINAFDIDNQDVINYGRYLGVDVKTNLDALRVLTIGCRFYHNNYQPCLKLGELHESFFDTERFMDIAFTQYFDRQCLINPPKTDEKIFIKQVFGSDFGIEKN